MPTVRAGLMMTNVSLCRLQHQQQQKHGCAAEGENKKGKKIVPQKRKLLCTYLMTRTETSLELIGCLQLFSTPMNVLSYHKMEEPLKYT